MEVRQTITCNVKGASFQNFNKNKLEDLMTDVISRTSAAKIGFRIEAKSYAESPKPAEKTVIVVDQYEANICGIPVRIQLAGSEIRWTLIVYLKKEIQSKNASFRKEMRGAAYAVYEKENPEAPTEKEEQGKKKAEQKKKKESPIGLSVGKTAVPEEGVDALSEPDAEKMGVGEGGANTPPKEKKKRKPRTKTADVITEEMIGQILEKWKRKAGVQRITQREFWKILPSSLVRVNKQVLVAFLRKKGVVVVVPFSRNPQLEMTPLGTELLEKHKLSCEKKEQEVEKGNLIQKTLEFPCKTLSLLKAIAELQETYVRLSAVRGEKESLAKKIKELRDELVSQEAQLGKIETREKEIAAKIERLVSQLNPGEVAELAETAQKVSSLK